MQDPGPSSSSSSGGPRAQLAPRSNNNSLRRTSQRPPEDPADLFDGFERAEADLSWHAPRSEDINPKTGEVWLYPKKRGNGPSNLEDFRKEIEERTRNGQGGKAIAEALIEKGVDTNGKAISAQRLRWGIRTKALRRTTERGIANIRKANIERKAREANAVRARSLPQKERVRKMRQAEILRMNREGMSLSQIEENLKARGVTFERGGFKRLCTKLGLAPDPQYSVRTIRAHYYNQARSQQQREFENIAAELGIEDVEKWTKSNMDEERFIIARRERAYKLMGDFRPTHPYPVKRKNRTQGPREGQDNVEPSADQQAASAETNTPQGSGRAHDPVELSDGDTDMGSQGDEDCEGSNDERAATEEVQPCPSPVGIRTDTPRPSPSRPGSNDAGSNSSPQPAAPTTEHASPDPQRSQVARLHNPGPIDNVIPSLPNSVPEAHCTPGATMREMPAAPIGIGHGHPTPTQQQQQSPQYSCAAPAVSAPFQPSAQGRVELRQPSAPTTGHRPIAPRPAYTRSIFRPPVLSNPGVTIPTGGAEIMAAYGLYPVPTSKPTTQKFQTPNSLVTTEGYEYLPLAWIRRSQLGSSAAGEMPPQREQEEQQSQHLNQPQHQSDTQLVQIYTAPHPPRSQAPTMPSMSPPRPSNAPVRPQPVSRKDASTQTLSSDTMPPPSPPRSEVPAPPLNIPAEETSRHKASYETVLKHQKASFECMQYLMARSEARPLPESLTGLPPSLKDVEIAKVRLRESAEALLAALE